MNTFINKEDLIKNTQISNNVDAELLVPHIIIAQDMYITSILGEALSTELLDQIEAGSISGHNYTLWQEYIIPAASYYTWYSAAPFMAFKTHRSGIIRQTTDNSESTSMEEFSYYVKRVEKTAIHYATRLETYLHDNADNFPLYRRFCGKSQVNKGGGLYLRY